jgi:hypothetical protein
MIRNEGVVGRKREMHSSPQELRGEWVGDRRLMNKILCFAFSVCRPL